MTMLTREVILNHLVDMKKELEKDGITKIGLFGSYAKGKADLASDVDIVICTSQEFLDKFKGFDGAIYLDNLRQKLTKHFKRQVDLCDIFSITQEKKGLLLKESLYV